MSLKYQIFTNIVNLISRTWIIKISGNIPKEPAIVAFWHGEMLPVWKYFSKFKPIAIVSPSKDGEILANLLKKWNYRLIRGSSDKKSKETLNQIIESAKDSLVLITPDGPRGPLHKFKPGAVVASMRANVGLYLCSVEIKRKIIFKKSWDKFIFPLPFSKILLKISGPINIPSNSIREDVDYYIDLAENILNNNKL